MPLLEPLLEISGIVILTPEGPQIVEVPTSNDDLRIWDLLKLANKVKITCVELPQSAEIARLLGEILFAPLEPTLIEALCKPIAELALSVRSLNCASNSKAVFVWELVVMNEETYLKTKYFGRKSINEIKEVLAELHPKIVLGMSPNDPHVARARARTATQKS